MGRPDTRGHREARDDNAINNPVERRGCSVTVHGTSLEDVLHIAKLYGELGSHSYVSEIMNR